MRPLDFLAMLPAEEKEIFLDLLEETGSTDLAIQGTMEILADSEPRLARQLERSIGDCSNTNQPIKDEHASGWTGRTGKTAIGAFGLDLLHVMKALLPSPRR